jgi:hypothetical protein
MAKLLKYFMALMEIDGVTGFFNVKLAAVSSYRQRIPIFRVVIKTREAL